MPKNGKSISDKELTQLEQNDFVKCLAILLQDPWLRQFVLSWPDFPLDAKKEIVRITETE